MKEFILDYMANKDVYASDRTEQEKLEAGIALYLLENGIETDESGEYYKQYLTGRLDLLSREDLKKYFVCYPVISEIVQIVMEYKNDGCVSETAINDLRKKMKLLYDNGLGDKYVPADVIRQILA